MVFLINLNPVPKFLQPLPFTYKPLSSRECGFIDITFIFFLGNIKFSMITLYPWIPPHVKQMQTKVTWVVHCTLNLPPSLPPSPLLAFAWIPPCSLSAPPLSPPIFSCNYRECSMIQLSSLWWKRQICHKMLSFSKLAKGHTQNIKVIICDFCLIFLCSVPIFL